MTLRKTQGAILCPGCRRLIDADERACPHCGVAHPGMFGFGHFVSGLFGGRADLTGILTIALVALYGGTLALDLRGISFGGLFSLLSPSSRALYSFGMTGGEAHLLGHHWTILSATLLHGGLLHLGFNVMWLRALGPTVAEELGAARLAVAFVLTGAAGNALSNAYGALQQGTPWPSIGASGAIFGLMGVLLMFGRRRGGEWGRALASRVAGWALIAFGAGFIMPNVNNAAHFGGLVAGLLLGAVMPRRDRAAQGAGLQLLALCCLIGSVLAVLASVFFMSPLQFNLG